MKEGNVVSWYKSLDVRGHNEQQQAFSLFLTL